MDLLLLLDFFFFNFCWLFSLGFEKIQKRSFFFYELIFVGLGFGEMKKFFFVGCFVCILRKSKK